MQGRYGVVFSCPNRRFGSQWALFQGLMPALHSLRPDMVHFSVTGVEPGLAGVPTILLPPQLAAGNPFQTISRLISYQGKAGRLVRNAGCERLLVPFTHEMLRRPGIPQAVIVHDLLPLRFPEWYAQMALFWKWHLLPSLRRCSKVIAVSQQTKNDLIELGGLSESQIRVIYNGFTPSSANSEVARVAGELLCVSSSQLPHKNLSRLLQSVRQVREAHPNVNLRIVAKHEDRFTPALREEAAALGLENSVSFEEDLTESEMTLAYQRASLFVYPSLYEGFGIPPLEAMASGLPVVASNTGAVAEVCGSAALSFDPTSVESISAAIQRGLTDQSLRHSLAAAGLIRAKDFSWSKAASEMITWMEAP